MNSLAIKVLDIIVNQIQNAGFNITPFESESTTLLHISKLGSTDHRGELYYHAQDDQFMLTLYYYDISGKEVCVPNNQPNQTGFTHYLKYDDTAGLIYFQNVLDNVLCELRSPTPPPSPYVNIQYADGTPPAVIQAFESAIQLITQRGIDHTSKGLRFVHAQLGDMGYMLDETGTLRRIKDYYVSNSKEL